MMEKMKLVIPKGTRELMKYIQGIFDKPIYLVGGAVRDLILGHEPKDYDFSTALTTDEVEAQLKGKHRVYLTGKRSGTIGFKYRGEIVELTTFRTKEYTAGSIHLEVKFVVDIKEDLSRRDLTINSMAIDCNNFNLIDYFHGLDDLRNKIIKTVGKAEDRFSEDPLRILRTVRFAATYGFDFEKNTYKQIQELAFGLLFISKERIMVEMDKILILSGESTAYALDTLWLRGIFSYIIPELQLQRNEYFEEGDEFLYTHTRKQVEMAAVDIDLRWALLLKKLSLPFLRNKYNTSEISYLLLTIELVNRLSLSLKWSKERFKSVIKLIKLL